MIDFICLGTHWDGAGNPIASPFHMMCMWSVTEVSSISTQDIWKLYEWSSTLTCGLYLWANYIGSLTPPTSPLKPAGVLRSTEVAWKAKVVKHLFSDACAALSMTVWFSQWMGNSIPSKTKEQHSQECSPPQGTTLLIFQVLVLVTMMMPEEAPAEIVDYRLLILLTQE